MSISFGILTISDTCCKDASKDKSGPELERLITTPDNNIGIAVKGAVLKKKIVSDDEEQIKKTLIKWSDKLKINVIITTGGTGFSKRDVTPEATRKVIKKEALGLSLAMINESLKITPTAILSRSVCGIRDESLIINLPGSVKAARECLEAIASVIPHAVDLILDNKSHVTEAHSDIQRSNCKHGDDLNTSFTMGGVASRLRSSPYPMVSMDEVAKIIFNEVTPLYGYDTVKLGDCHGRILFDDIHSLCNLPPFRASIKDGYAVIADDKSTQKTVLGGSEAGQMPSSMKLTKGCCVRVNTGAPVPDEATAVVQVEDTKLISKNDDDSEKEIEILNQPTEGQDIRPIGSDIRKDERVMLRRTKIGAAEAGILAACGYAAVSVTRVPKIGVLSTGNELQPAGDSPKLGRVYDSNKITLIMLLKEYGYDAVGVGIAKDEENLLINAISNALKMVDVLITTGSVSMGDKDMLKPILSEVFKAKIHFGRVNMKPGKPTTFATCEFEGKAKYILCLPGNPVSATVTAHLFAIPILNRLTDDHTKPIIIRARLTSSYKLDPRPEYARVILQWENDDIPNAYSTGNQISSRLLSCKNANALLMLPGRTADCDEKRKGDIVQVMLLGFGQIEI